MKKQTSLFQVIKEPIPFINCSKETQKELNKIIEDDKEFLSTKKLKFLNDEILIPFGRIFIAESKGEIIGFVVCFDNVNEKSFPQKIFSRYFNQEHVFTEELATIGRFAIITTFCVKKEFRKKRVSKGLIEVLDEFYKKRTVLIGGLLSEKNFYILKTLKQNDYLFINFLEKQNKDKILYFKAIKILKSAQFFNAINKENLSKAFNIIIPTQLNHTTQNINTLLENLNNPARITWSSFFQYDYPILSEVYNMENNYTGYYETLISAHTKEDFDEILRDLKKVLNYLKGKDVSKYSERLPSISPGLKSKGFELFFISENPALHKFRSFGNPIGFDLNHVNIYEVLSELTITEPFNEISDWFNAQKAFLLVDSIKEKISKTKEDLKKGKYIDRDRIRLKYNENQLAKNMALISKWKKWMKEKNISKEEETHLKFLYKKYFHDLNRTKANQSSDNESYNNEKISREEIIQAKKEQSKYRKKEIIPIEKLDEWNNWLDLHRIFMRADNRMMKKNEIWCHAVVPINFTGGLIGVMFNFIITKKEKQLKDNELNNIAYTISSAFSKNMFNIIIKLQDGITDEFMMKNAIATVMNRNLSHNIGSHILVKLGSKKSLEKLVREKNTVLPNLHPIASFNNYLRTRIDFLADVSTSKPITSTSYYLNRDIIQPFNQERIVTTFISGTKLEEIIIRFGGDEDVKLQVPNAELGKHAFYIIFENIIRNSIKHESESVPTRFSLTIEIKENPNGRGYTVSITDDIERSEDGVAKIVRKYINKQIIINKHKIRPEGWGIIEMKVAAAYLRKKMPADYLITSQNNSNKFGKNDPVLLSVSDKLNGNGKYNLCYNIYLKKPREILIIDGTNSLDNKLSDEDLMRIGIKIIKLEDLEESITKPHSHNFSVWFGKFNKKIKFQSMKTFPIRKVFISLEEQMSHFIDLLTQSKLDELVLNIWELWIKDYFQGKDSIKTRDIFFRMDNDRFDNKWKNIKPSHIALFDKHGSGAKDGLYVPHELSYYEAFSGRTPLGVILNNWSKFIGLEKETMSFYLKEATLTNVIILDERIQNEAEKSKPSQGIKAKDYIEELKWKNIFIPRKTDVDLYKSSLTKEDKFNLLSWVRNTFCNYKRIDFVILHLGLLERLPEISNDFEEFIETNFYANGNHSPPNIVIISGRGMPAKIPQNTMFMNYSNIVKYILDDRSKFHLCQILFSVRANLEENEV